MKLHAQFNKDEMHIRMKLSDSSVYLWTPLASAVDTDRKEEECSSPNIRFRQKGASWEAEVLWKSSIWKSKKHYYKFVNNRLFHRIEVAGSGRISRLTYFSGTVNGHELACVPGFGSVYTACPNFLEKAFSHPSEYTAISAGNTTELWGSALNTGPLMFAYGETGEKGWIGAGVLARPGQYGFQTMALNLKRQHALGVHDNIIGTQAITLDYSGDEMVDGKWESPELMTFAGDTPQDCMRAYCRKVFMGGYAVKRVKRRVKWWRKPVFCTWHEQVALGRMERQALTGREGLESAPNFFDKINEKNVRHWLDIFESKKIHFGTIIFDAKWQKDDGSNESDPAKFPNMRSFIDELHGRGYRVMLWMNAWEFVNIPKAWCVKRAGKPVMADPTHPEYRQHMRKMIWRMLGDGPGCYNADGLKIDGTNSLPGGKGLRSHGNIYGIELLHAYLKTAYDAAKEAKSDALVSIFGANPYLSDCCDMVRLGDLYTFRGDPLSTMRWRSDVFRAGLPHAVLDTDGALRFSVRNDTRQLLEEQARIGILCLYQAEYLYKNRAFTKEKIRKITEKEYRIIRRAINSYREKTDSG